MKQPIVDNEFDGAMEDSILDSISPRLRRQVLNEAAKANNPPKGWSSRKLLLWMIAAYMFAVPVGLIGFALCLTIIGAVVGIPIMMIAASPIATVMRRYIKARNGL